MARQSRSVTRAAALRCGTDGAAADIHAQASGHPSVDIALPRKKRKITGKAAAPAVEYQGRQYFLMKAEPESRIEKGIDVKFSIDDLQRLGSEPWDGVRNTEASKTMRDRMKLGDQAFFYHSNTKNPGIAGIATVCREGYPDSSAWEPAHPYYDPKSDKDKPKWYRVDVKYERHLARFVSLRELKLGNFPELANMQLLRRPQLSVQRVTEAEWQKILELERQSPEKQDNEANSSALQGPERATTKAQSAQTKHFSHDDDVKAEIIATHGGPCD